MEAQVMNGTVSAGDRVCYPVRMSSSMWMNIAEVVEVGQCKIYSWLEDTKPCLKVRILQNSDGDVPSGKISTITVLDRVVKL